MRTVPHIGFVLEQTLGHITHTDNLRRLVPRHDAIEATFLPIEFGVEGVAARLQGYGNCTVRAGVRSRRAIRRARRAKPFDAMFVHTQVLAVLIPDHVGRVPTVVSLDATQRQYDELGDHYAHATSGPRIERLKWRANRNCLRRAAGVGAIHEIVRDDDTGHLVAPGDVGALTERLRQLVVDGPLRRGLGERAAGLVSEHFDAAKNAAALVELMAETARRGRA